MTEVIFTELCPKQVKKNAIKTSTTLFKLAFMHCAESGHIPVLHLQQMMPLKINESY